MFAATVSDFDAYFLQLLFCAQAKSKPSLWLMRRRCSYLPSQIESATAHERRREVISTFCCPGTGSKDRSVWNLALPCLLLLGLNWMRKNAQD
eukprot:2952170-Amphidinium_carterae.1